MGFSNNPLLDP